MKLLIILSLGLLSFGAMAQPDSKFDTPQVKEWQRQARADARKAKAQAQAREFESVVTENFTIQGSIYNTKLKIEGDGNEAEVSVSIRRTNGQSVKSGTGYVTYNHFKTTVKAQDQKEVEELISEGLELESKSLLNHIGFGESRKAHLSSQGNADQIDFSGNGLEITFSK